MYMRVSALPFYLVWIESVPAGKHEEFEVSIILVFRWVCSSARRKRKPKRWMSKTMTSSDVDGGKWSHVLHVRSRDCFVSVSLYAHKNHQASVSLYAHKNHQASVSLYVAKNHQAY